MQSTVRPLDLITFDSKVPKLPPITCDVPLDPKLTNHPLLSNCNCFFFMVIVGKPGTGKSSLWGSMLTERSMFKKVFDRIYIFMPANSMSSFRHDCLLHELPEDQKYPDLTLQTFNDVCAKIEENKAKDWTSLVIFDDVQQYLKGPIQDGLLHLVANRRHQKCALMVAAQTYKKIPLPVRILASDLFAFNPSVANRKEIEAELSSFDRDKFEKIFITYNTFRKKHPRAFIYINLTSDTVFLDWNHKIDPNLI